MKLLEDNYPYEQNRINALGDSVNQIQNTKNRAMTKTNNPKVKQSSRHLKIKLTGLQNKSPAVTDVPENTLTPTSLF